MLQRLNHYRQIKITKLFAYFEIYKQSKTIQLMVLHHHYYHLFGDVSQISMRHKIIVSQVETNYRIDSEVKIQIIEKCCIKTLRFLQFDITSHWQPYEICDQTLIFHSRSFQAVKSEGITM